jgi:hypothetical protein
LKTLTVAIQGNSERDIRPASLVKTIDNLAYIELQLELLSDLPVTVAFAYEPSSRPL